MLFIYVFFYLSLAMSKQHTKIIGNLLMSFRSHLELVDTDNNPIVNSDSCSFDNDLWIRNPHLSRLDFFVNKIQVFSISLLQNNAALTMLWIVDNLIEIFDQSVD